MESSAQRDQRAVALRAKLEVELRRGSGATDDELVRAAEGEAHRPAKANREQRKERLEQLDLAAKAATHGHADNAHLVRRQVEEPGDRVADDEWPLRGRPHGEAPVRLGPDDRHVRLHERLVGAGDPVRALHHDVGRLQGGIGVAPLEVGHSGDVAQPLVGRSVGRG